jgi:hypothetical protein
MPQTCGVSGDGYGIRLFVLQTRSVIFLSGLVECQEHEAGEAGAGGQVCVGPM